MGKGRLPMSNHARAVAFSPPRRRRVGAWERPNSAGIETREPGGAGFLVMGITRKTGFGEIQLRPEKEEQGG